MGRISGSSAAANSLVPADSGKRKYDHTSEGAAATDQSGTGRTNVSTLKSSQQAGQKYRKLLHAADAPAYKSREVYYKNPNLGMTTIGDMKQYTFKEMPLFRPYKTDVEKAAKREFIGEGKLHTVERRLNPDAPVYVKFITDPEVIAASDTGEMDSSDEESLIPSRAEIIRQSEINDRFTARLLGGDAKAIQMRPHFAIDVLKEIRGKTAVHLVERVPGRTPDEPGPALAQYCEEPGKFAEHLPYKDLVAELHRFRAALQGFHDWGFLHGDLTPDESEGPITGNLVLNLQTKKVVLIDPETISETTDHEELQAEMDELDNLIAEIESYADEWAKEHG